jgi:hypothetical protein
VIELPSGVGGGGGGGGGKVVFRRGGIGVEATEDVDPPPVPELGEGDPVISDGEFLEDLPYGPQTVTQAPNGWPSTEAASLEAGVDPKRTPTLIAGGLILVVAAALVRRYLSAISPEVRRV